jgi:hypothetical protein
MSPPRDTPYQLVRRWALLLSSVMLMASVGVAVVLGNVPLGTVAVLLLAARMLARS